MVAVRRGALILAVAVALMSFLVAMAFVRNKGTNSDGEDLLARAGNVDTVCALLHQVSVQQNMTGSVASPAALTSYQAFMAEATATGATSFINTAQDARDELTELSTIAPDTDPDPDGLPDLYRRTLRVQIDLAKMSLACVLRGRLPGGAPQTTKTRKR